MATTEADKRELLGFGLSYSLAETGGGIALIVLSILALAKMDPMLLNAIAVIVAGIALLIEDESLSGGYTGALGYRPARVVESAAEGAGAGTLAGISGVVLGILAILGIEAAALTAVAIVIFGAAVLFDFGARMKITTSQTTRGANSDPSSRLALTATGSSNSSAIVVGVALIALGILALAGLASAILVTVALLSLGAYLFTQNAFVAGSLFGMAL